MDESKLKHLQTLYAGGHKNFLAAQHPKTYAEMAEKGTLDSYLMMIGEQAADHYLTLKEQMLEQAKTIEDPREREVYINQIPFVAAEIVKAEIVHVKL